MHCDLHCQYFHNYRKQTGLVFCDCRDECDRILRTPDWLLVRVFLNTALLDE